MARWLYVQVEGDRQYSCGIIRAIQCPHGNNVVVVHDLQPIARHGRSDGEAVGGNLAATLADASGEIVGRVLTNRVHQCGAYF